MKPHWRIWRGKITRLWFVSVWDNETHSWIPVSHGYFSRWIDAVAKVNSLAREYEEAQREVPC